MIFKNKFERRIADQNESTGEWFLKASNVVKDEPIHGARRNNTIYGRGRHYATTRGLLIALHLQKPVPRIPRHVSAKMFRSNNNEQVGTMFNGFAFKQFNKPDIHPASRSNAS